MKKTILYFYYSRSAGEGKKNSANPVRNFSLWVSNGAKINEKAHIAGVFQLIIGVEILPLRHFGSFDDAQDECAQCRRLRIA